MSKHEIADRVDLVKRACDATVEITRQLGAELVLTMGSLAMVREQANTLAATTKTIIKERDEALEEVKRLRAELEQVRQRQPVLAEFESTIPPNPQGPA